MVGSTAYKQNHSDVEWLSRAVKFCEVIALDIELCGGEVVKFIGDEVMSVFRGEGRFENACTYLSEYIGESCELLLGDKDPVALKVTVNCGEVYFYKYPKMAEEDPQGSVVDKCARQGKAFIKKTSGVVMSKEFAMRVNSLLKTTSLGVVNLLEFGDQELFSSKEMLASGAIPLVRIPSGQSVCLNERLLETSNCELFRITPKDSGEWTLEFVHPTKGGGSCLLDDGDSHSFELHRLRWYFLNSEGRLTAWFSPKSDTAKYFEVEV